MSLIRKGYQSGRQHGNGERIGRFFSSVRLCLRNGDAMLIPVQLSRCCDFSVDGCDLRF
jgi:hypothetical protein